MIGMRSIPHIFTSTPKDCGFTGFMGIYANLLDLRGFTLIYFDTRLSSWIYMELHEFTWIYIDTRGIP